jgi:hypothetical protein
MSAAGNRSYGPDAVVARPGRRFCADVLWGDLGGHLIERLG